ncbi:DUF551 domain-containing protein [Escherichia coli]|nr:DUF551 domain-containing protein [Escherichia coli]MGQ64980.1 DUF551 domain-containing protein [Escherichia coli]
MTTFTDKEMIKEIKERIGSLDVRDNIERRAYEIALASLEAEPVAVNDDMAYAFHHALSDSSLGADEVEEIKAGLRAAFANVTIQPEPVVPDNASEPLAYAYKELTPEIMRNHLAVFERYGIAPNDSSTTIQALRIALDGIERSDAMLHGAEPVSQTYKLNQLSGNSPATPDGWISCSERMPNTKTAVLVAVEFDRKGDWRMKWATYIPGHPDANDGWIIPGASWKPSHWMPLPEPPQEVNQ